MTILDKPENITVARNALSYLESRVWNSTLDEDLIADCLQIIRETESELNRLNYNKLAEKMDWPVYDRAGWEKYEKEMEQYEKEEAEIAAEYNESVASRGDNWW